MAATVLRSVPAENWDDDFEFQQPSTSTNHPHPRISTASSQLTEDWDIDSNSKKSNDISAWAEPGPSTPTKRLVTDAENWDDDFQDKTDSPSQNVQPRQSRENWDEDFDADDDDEEEDRTVTARSRSVALSRLASNATNPSPPPPVPPIPFSLISSQEHSFPRSPTASVFSVPTSGRDSVAAYSFSSTTHLRPAASAHPVQAQVHPQRERRRLRKKSRPQDPPQNYYPAMYPVNSSQESVGDIDRHSRPITPSSHRSPSPSPNPPSNRNSIAGLPSSPPTRTPLLSRIGSVKKKWAVRKKRASSAPSEIILQEGEAANDPTPQPPSSADIHSSSKQLSGNWFSRAASGSSGNSGNSASSSEVVPAGDHTTPKASKSRTPATDALPPPPLLPPFDPSNPANQATPSKLVKRKSFGFVQLRPRNIPINDMTIDSSPSGSPSTSPHSSAALSSHSRPPRNPIRTSNYHQTINARSSASTSDIPSDLEAELFSASAPSQDSDVAAGRSPSKRAKTQNARERPTQSRHGSYGGLGLGRASEAQRSTDNLDRESDGRRRSFSRSSRTSRARSKSHSRLKAGTESSDAEERDTNFKDKEGNRGFMGSVRRISFGSSKPSKHPGHKRTKSGVSLASVTEGIKKSLERHGKERERNGDAMDMDIPQGIGTDGESATGNMDVEMDLSKTPPLGSSQLLPPIELYPPSPPSPPRIGASRSSLNLSSPASTTLFLVSKSSSSSTVVPKVHGSTGTVSKSQAGVIATASLGRSTIVPSIGGIGKAGHPSMQTSSSMPGGPSTTTTNVPRRNSMGDLKLGELKIPARISQAQVGLRRDLGMVKEFAGRVEQLKSLQTTYHNLVIEVQEILDAQHAQHAKHGPSSTTSPLPSPITGNIFRPLSRMRSSTSTSPSRSSPSSLSVSVSPSSPATLSPSPPLSVPATSSPDIVFPEPVSTFAASVDVHHYKHLAAAFYTINSKYKIAWECAELLIELGGGPSASGELSTTLVLNSPPLPRPSTAESAQGNQSKKSRERAITLSGEQSKPGTPTPGAGPSHASSYTASSYGSYTPSTHNGSAGTPNMAWRASTGRHDLNQRQLVLLREMLNNSDSSFVTEGTSPFFQIHQPLFPPPPPHRHSQQSSPVTGTPPPIPLDVDHLGREYVNREWRWGGGGVSDAMNSTVTLPSEESSGLPSSNAYGGGSANAGGHGSGADNKKRRSSRLKGMSGLRDMLRNLTRQQTQSISPIVSTIVPASTTSLSASTESSSVDTGHGHRYPHAKVPSATANTSNYSTYGRRRAKTSSGPEDRDRGRWEDRDRERVSNSPYSASSLSVKASPRRPSLASIFRMGMKGGSSSNSTANSAKSSPSSKPMSGAGVSTDNVTSPHTRESSSGTAASMTDEEDWDRLELEYPIHARDDTARPHKSTVRGKSPYMQQDAPLPPPVPYLQGRSASTSQTSLSLASTSVPGVGIPGIPARPTRLSNVDENPDDPRASKTSLNLSSSKPNLAAKTGSVRSMPPQPIQLIQAEGNGVLSHKLAMTPENIKPLLENAKEVHARLQDCIGEIRMLLVQD
ncbi:hypothetical protein GYMLUDRAFT_33070 [Collybiopsis luxurians FD-317 M1]|nr:hypothetical protein GYMLUDRAFT_33070 [Collybiopsis luxurians FD-317 M1]